MTFDPTHGVDENDAAYQKLHRHTPARIDPTPPAAARDLAVELGITDERLYIELLRLLEEAKQGTPTFDRDGTHVADIPNLPVALRAIELLMRNRGMLTEHHDHQHQHTVRIELVGVDPDQLR